MGRSRPAPPRSAHAAGRPVEIPSVPARGAGGGRDGVGPDRCSRRHRPSHRLARHRRRRPPEPSSTLLPAHGWSAADRRRLPRSSIRSRCETGSRRRGPRQEAGGALSDSRGTSTVDWVVVLVSQSATLTARETLAVLGVRGVRTDVLATGRLTVGRFSAWRRRPIPAPPPSRDPLGYLAVVRRLMTSGGYQAALATHEQSWLSAAGPLLLPQDAPMAVASIEAFDRVAGKVDFARLLDELHVPQPRLAGRGPPVDGWLPALGEGVAWSCWPLCATGRQRQDGTRGGPGAVLAP